MGATCRGGRAPVVETAPTLVTYYPHSSVLFPGRGRHPWARRQGVNPWEHWEMSSEDVVFTGGANVPTSDSWRLNASIPFASLRVSESTVTLELGKVAHLVGDPLRLVARLEDLASVYPIRGRVMSRGVGLRTIDGNDFYFWTPSPANVLALLQERGYPVTDVAEKARKVWSGES